jgi:hypothetical protein
MWPQRRHDYREVGDRGPIGHNDGRLGERANISRAVCFDLGWAQRHKPSFTFHFKWVLTGAAVASPRAHTTVQPGHGQKNGEIIIKSFCWSLVDISRTKGCVKAWLICCP